MHPPLPGLRELLIGTQPVCLGWDAPAFSSESDLTAAEHAAGMAEGTLAAMRRFAAGRRAARMALGMLTGERTWEVVREREGEARGRPRVAAGVGLDVSISHCGGLSVAAAAHGVQVGVKLFDEASDWGDEEDVLAQAGANERGESFDFLSPDERKRLIGAVKVALWKAGGAARVSVRELSLVAWDVHQVQGAHAFALSVQAPSSVTLGGGWFSGAIRRNVHGRMGIAAVALGM